VVIPLYIIVQGGFMLKKTISYFIALILASAASFADDTGDKKDETINKMRGLLILL
jgi:hypothetical protein